MAAACAFGGLAVLSGCGSGGDPVAKAAEATVAKRTARVALSLSTRSQPLAESLGFGAVDFARSRSRTRYPAMGRHGHEWHAAGAGRVFYVEQSKGRWLRLDETKLDRLYRPLGHGSSALLTPRESGSYELLAGLEHARRSVLVGRGRVAGVRVTRYRTTTPAAAGSLDVWVDREGLIRQIRAGTSTDRELGTIFTTWRLSRFGGRVHVTLPPPREVTTTNGGR